MTVLPLDDGNREQFRNLFADRVWEQLKESGMMALGAVLDERDTFGQTGLAVGTLAAEVGEDSVDIPWIYIEDGYRGHGCGEKLLTEFITAVRKQGFCRNMYSFFPDSAACDPLHDCLEKLGFRLENVSEAEVYSVTVKEIAEPKLWRSVGIADGAIPFRALPDMQLKMFNSKMREAPSAAIEFPLPKQGFLPCSMAYVRENELRGLLLFVKKETGAGAALVYVWTKKGEKRALPAMLCVAARTLSHAYPPAAEISLATLNDASRVIAHALKPNAEAMGVWVAQLAMED